MNADARRTSFERRDDDLNCHLLPQPFVNKTRKLDGNKNRDKSGAKAKKPQKRNKQITPKQARTMEKRSGSKEKRTKSNSQIYVGMDVHKDDTHGSDRQEQQDVKE